MAMHINQRAKHNNFLVLCTGHVDTAYVSRGLQRDRRSRSPTSVLLQFPDLDTIDCKYAFHYGADWEVKSVSQPGRSAWHRTTRRAVAGRRERRLAHVARG